VAYPLSSLHVPPGVRVPQVENRWSSGYGRRVMTERSWVQNPHYGDHFSGPIHLDQSLEQKLWKTITWHCCMCCNPANGRVDFVELLAYGTEWIVSLSANYKQSPTTTTTKKLFTNFQTVNTKLNFSELLNTV